MSCASFRLTAWARNACAEFARSGHSARRSLSSHAMSPTGVRVKRALEEVRAKFGPIDGIIHAAGVMDDEPIESKSLSSMRRVLYPKIAGAIHLDRLIHEPLDFFILFSSVASSLGLPGQVDYTAANAFLDAFAIDRASRAPGRTVVINWNAWRDIGMAARASEEQQHGRAPSSVVAHPALDGYSDDHGTGRTFRDELRNRQALAAIRAQDQEWYGAPVRHNLCRTGAGRFLRRQGLRAPSRSTISRFLSRSRLRKAQRGD